MNPFRYQLTRLAVLFGLAAVVALWPTARQAWAQPSLQTLFEAPLTDQAGGQPVRRGTVLGTLNGQSLRLFGAFNGLSLPWVQADLYRGDPAQPAEAELVENLALLISDPFAFGGGFDRTVTLSASQLEDLHGGLLFVVIRTSTTSPESGLRGRIESSPAALPDPVETPLSQIWGGFPVARGHVRALFTDQGLRLIGYVQGLESNWQQIALYRGAHGSQGEHVGSILSFGAPGLYDGFEHTFALEPGWEQDVLEGRYYLEVQTSRPGDRLRGQILPASNQAPAAASVLSPAAGEIVVIGGLDGEDPVDPDVYLGTVSFTPVEDPEDHPVTYLWQASLRSHFSSQTITFDLGVDSTRVLLTVGAAAALFDSLTSMLPGPVAPGTPVPVYHRVITTDGSRFAIGEGVETTFIRGAITAREPGGDLPSGFRLHGNYPNPFNPGTTILFDLAAAAEVHVEVFNALGQTVLTVPAGRLAAGASHRVAIDAGTLPSGVYVYRVVAQGEGPAHTATGRMLLLK